MSRPADALKGIVGKMYPNGKKRSNGRISLDRYKGALERISAGDLEFAYSTLDDEELFAKLGPGTREAIGQLSFVRREADVLRDSEEAVTRSAADIQTQMATYQNELDEYAVVHDTINSVQSAAANKVQTMVPQKGKRKSRLTRVVSAAKDQSIHEARETAGSELGVYERLNQELTESSRDFRVSKRRRDYEVALAEYSSTFSRYKDAAEVFNKTRGRLTDRAKHSVNEFGFSEDAAKHQYRAFDTLETDVRKQLAGTRKKMGSVNGRLKILQRSKMPKEVRDLKTEELEKQRVVLQSSYQGLESRLQDIERNRQELHSRGINGFLDATEMRKNGSLATVDEFGFIVHKEKTGLLDRVKDKLGRTSQERRVREYAETADTLRSLERELEDKMLVYLGSAEALRRYDKTVPITNPAQRRKEAEGRISELRGTLKSLHEAKVVSRSAIDVAELVHKSANDRLKLLELHSKLVPQNRDSAAAEDAQSAMYASLDAYQESLGEAAGSLDISAGVEREAVIKRSVRRELNDYRSMVQTFDEAEKEIATKLGDKKYARRSWKEAVQKQIGITRQEVKTTELELAGAMETINGIREQRSGLEGRRHELESMLIKNARVEYDSLLKRLEDVSNGGKTEELSEADVRKYSAQRLKKTDIRPTESSPEFDAGDVSLLKLKLLDNLPRIAGGITFGGTLLGMAVVGGGLEYGLIEGLGREGGRLWESISNGRTGVPTENTVYDVLALLGSATAGFGVRVVVERGIERSAGIMVDTEIEKLPTALANADLITGLSPDVKQELGKRNLTGRLERKRYGKTLVSSDAQTLEGRGKIRWTGDQNEHRVKLITKPKTELELAATTIPLNSRRVSLTHDPLETTVGLGLLARYGNDVKVGDAVIVHYLQTNGQRGRAHDRPRIHDVVEGKGLTRLDMERLVQLRVETGKDLRMATKIGLGGFEKIQTPTVVAQGTETPADIA